MSKKSNFDESAGHVLTHTQNTVKLSPYSTPQDLLGVMKRKEETEASETEGKGDPATSSTEDYND